jgi:hypothetical protein
MIERDRHWPWPRSYAVQEPLVIGAQSLRYGQQVLCCCLAPFFIVTRIETRFGRSYGCGVAFEKGQVVGVINGAVGPL